MQGRRGCRAAARSLPVPHRSAREDGSLSSRLLLAVTLLGLTAVFGLLAAGQSPAQATGCLPAGGAADALPDPAGGDDEVVVTGRGWGHGVGLSQYGAQGAARLGCNAREIVETYYPGAAVAGVDSAGAIDVALLPTRPAGARPSEVEVFAREAVPWQHDGGTLTQPAGQTWTVTAAQGRVTLRDADGQTQLDSDGSPLRAVHGDGIVQLPAKPLTSAEQQDWPEGRPYRHGELRFTPRSDGMTVVARVDSLERYLHNVREVPASWPAAALEAQAIAARSFAVAQRASGRRADCDCHAFDSTSSQVFYGYAYEADSRHAPWVAAVGATAAQGVTVDGRVVSANYAASHGGHSDSAAWVWGFPASHLQPVDDSRWELAADPSPFLTWTEGFSAEQVTARLSDAGHRIGTLQAITTPQPRGAGGRVGVPTRGAGGVAFVGSDDEVVLSGDAVRSLLGLRSTNFEVATDLSEDPCAAPPGAGEPSHLTRLWGPDRIATAVEVAAEFGRADTVLLAAARDFPDALAGAPLAAAQDAPLLLTGRDTLSAEVAEVIADLGASRIVLLGGPAALSPDVEAAAADLPAVEEVVRVSGGDRFATAAQIAGEVSDAGGLPDGEVILALGRHPQPSAAWPDALSAGALLVAGDPRPLLLTDHDGLPQATLEALNALDPQRVLVIGGPAAVGEAVLADLDAAGHTPVRFAGPDRYATSVAVLDAAVDRGAASTTLLFAQGAAFADALSAGALSAHTGAPLVLVPPCGLGSAPPIGDWVTAVQPPPRDGVLIGGPAALTPLSAYELDGLLAR